MEIREGRLDKILAKGRYHSAIATTYNIDPIFVSRVFIPILHSKRIRNITILADPREFDKALNKEENIIGLAGSSYLILPAKANRLFHPKVMIFIGKNEGLVLVGSGNLTHSGMGGNSEVWGAFHCSSSNSQHAHIFYQAWNFVRNHIPVLTVTANAKSREWIVNNAPWLQQILSQEFDNNSLDSRLLTNNADNTIWKSLEEAIQDKSISDVIVVSPFYDKAGLVLKGLRSLFPEAQISMIYDKQGTIPQISDEVEKIDCYAWQNISSASKDNDLGRRRLHAKIILLRDKNNDECLLFGSSNATDAGLGIIRNGDAANVELSVLADSTSLRFNDSLGIDLKKYEPEAITNIEVDERSLEEPNEYRPTNKLRVIYAEQHGDFITIVLNKEKHEEAVKFLIYSKNGKVTKQIVFKEIEQSTIKIQVPNDEASGTHFVEIEGNSCRVLVYHYKNLSLDNPDSRSELIRNTLSDIGSINFGSLHSSFINIFKELGEVKPNEDRSTSEGGKDELTGSDEERVYTKDELKERKRANMHKSSESFFVDGILALLSALNKQLVVEDDPEPSIEAVKNDSSEDIEQEETDDQTEEQIEEDISDIEKRIKGYRSYFKRTMRYYKKCKKSFNKEVKKSVEINKNFIANWILVTAIAVHVIYHDAKTKPVSEEILEGANRLDKKTTILPQKNAKGITINRVIKNLVPRIVGEMDKRDIRISEILEEDQRLEAAINTLLLIHLRHWNTSKTSIFKKLCVNVLKLFGFNDEDSLIRFKLVFREHAGVFLDEEIKINEWRYYNYFKTNYERFNSMNFAE